MSFIAGVYCFAIIFYSYETANGISASEYGAYKAGPTSEEGVQSASGSYSYTGPDNVVYTITYTAGLEGFVPQGAHIPTPPPIPEAIQKVIQYAGTGDSDKYQTYEAGKYQTYEGANKYQSYNGGAKYQTYDEGLKYQTYGDGLRSTPSKYTTAVPTPYTGYNPDYSKLASYNSKYEVQDNYTRKR